MTTRVGREGQENRGGIERYRPKVPIIVLTVGLLPVDASLVNTWFQKGRMQPDELFREFRRLLDHSSDTQQNASS